ncbi:MAG: ArsA family ATPase [Deltaproteobacteria bacterium]|nr:ArsA family ATPase [Deltaproteobacteria bacterium]
MTNAARNVDIAASVSGSLKGLHAIDEMLREKSILFVTGKGGVGKSVVSAMMALRTQELGLCPILFECDAPKRPPLLPHGKVPSNELKEIAPGILGVNQDSEDAVRAYAVASLPSKTLAEVLFENRVARLFLRASPSVSEMALVGRIVQLAENHDRQGPIIVDLHATGHALAMLRAPDGIMRVLRSGPVFERAKAVKEVLHDDKQTSVITVALPEELPVTELLEFLDALHDIEIPIGPTVVNAAFADPCPDLDEDALKNLVVHSSAASPFAQDVSVLKHWATRAERESARLEEGLNERSMGPLLRLPFVPYEDGETPLAGQLASLLRIVKAKGAKDAAAMDAAGGAS